MLGQVVAVNGYARSRSPDRRVHNIVLMGSGEPLDNYDNVIRFLHLVNAPEGLNISLRNISLSTCGLVPQHAPALAEEGSAGDPVGFPARPQRRSAPDSMMPVANAVSPWDDLFAGLPRITWPKPAAG